MSHLPLTEAFEQQRPAIVNAIAADIHARVGRDDPDISREQLIRFVDGAMQLLGQDLAEGASEHYASFWRAHGVERAREGAFSLDRLLNTIAISECVIVDQLAPYYAEDATATCRLVQQIYTILNQARTILYNVFTAAREEIIRAQTIAIQELSVPIVPIYHGVLVLPLVGQIDNQRANAIMQNLLEAVAQQEAMIVLLDITGVPLVDTATSNHLIQAMRALRLLGTEAVLVGISPEIAQTIVQLGIDLCRVTTLSNLEAGLAYALQQLGLRIVARQQ